MIHRRTFLCGLTLGIVAIPLAVGAEQTGKVPRVGFLVMARNQGVEDAFPRGLRDLGYVEGMGSYL